MTPVGWQMPRFGWQNHTHHHIDAVAVTRLPQTTPLLDRFTPVRPPEESPQDASHRPLWWSRFLKHHLARIDGSNDLKDLVNMTPQKHYLDLEDRGNHRPMLPERERTLPRIQAVFTPEHLAQRRAEWRRRPLLPQTVNTTAPNVMSAVQDTYTEIVGLLSKVVDGLHSFDGGKLDLTTVKGLEERLRVYTADLAHFVADAFVPLHSTEYFDWPLGGPSAKTMHRFLEGEALRPDDPAYRNLARGALRRRKDLPRVTRDTIAQTMLTVVRQSHESVYKIVAIQKAVLSDPAYTRTPERYEQELATRLRKQIILPRLKQAQELLAGILVSAWEEAHTRVSPGASLHPPSTDTSAPMTPTDKSSVLPPGKT